VSHVAELVHCIDGCGFGTTAINHAAFESAILRAEKMPILPQPKICRLTPPNRASPPPSF